MSDAQDIVEPDDGAVVGVILAAGASTRMPGRSKLVLPYGDSTVVGAAVRMAASADLDPVFVVTGCDSDLVENALLGTGARVVFNADYEAGIDTSLATGLAAASEVRALAAVVTLADEPDVDPRVAGKLIRAWREADLDAVRARYVDRPGHPVLLARSAFRHVAAGRQDASVWDRLSHAGLRVMELPVAQPAPSDIDRPSDYEEAVSRRRGR